MDNTIFFHRYMKRQNFSNQFLPLRYHKSLAYICMPLKHGESVEILLFRSCWWYLKFFLFWVCFRNSSNEIFAESVFTPIQKEWISFLYEFEFKERITFELIKSPIKSEWTTYFFKNVVFVLPNHFSVRSELALKYISINDKTGFSILRTML